MRNVRAVIACAAALGILLALFACCPVVICDLELPEGYMEAVRGQARGLYSRKLPLVPVAVKVEKLQAGTVCYRIYYFPFGTVGMSYDASDGYNMEKPLTGM